MTVPSTDVRYTGHQSQPTTMSTHHLKYKRSLVGSSGGVDTIDGFADSVQGGWSANGQVSHGHIVIDRTDESDDLEVPMLDGLSVRDFSYLIAHGVSEECSMRASTVFPYPKRAVLRQDPATPIGTRPPR